MTTLENTITITAPRDAVWATLSDLDQLDQYDPGVRVSSLVGDVGTGVGAQRRCELRPRGWYIERVEIWRPCDALAFELVECSFPVTSLRHEYTLESIGGATRVTQVMTYALKYGPAGNVLDLLALRRAWDRGIKKFLAGLKQHVEASIVVDLSG